MAVGIVATAFKPFRGQGWRVGLYVELDAPRYLALRLKVF